MGSPPSRQRAAMHRIPQTCRRGTQRVLRVFCRDDARRPSPHPGSAGNAARGSGGAVPDSDALSQCRSRGAAARSGAARPRRSAAFEGRSLSADPRRKRPGQSADHAPSPSPAPHAKHQPAEVPCRSGPPILQLAARRSAGWSRRRLSSAGRLAPLRPAAEPAPAAPDRSGRSTAAFRRASRDRRAHRTTGATSRRRLERETSSRGPRPRRSRRSPSAALASGRASRSRLRPDRSSGSS